MQQLQEKTQISHQQSVLLKHYVYVMQRKQTQIMLKVSVFVIVSYYVNCIYESAIFYSTGPRVCQMVANAPAYFSELLTSPKAGRAYRRGRLSTIDLLVLTCLVQLLWIMQTYLLLYKTSCYLNEEVNRTEPSPSVSVPCPREQVGVQGYGRVRNFYKVLE